MKGVVPILARKLIPMPMRDFLRPYWQFIKVRSATKARAREIAELGPEVRWTRFGKEEVEFWESVLDARNIDAKRWPETRATRTNPDLPLQPYVRELIDVPVGSPVKILDVGSGPLTSLGKKWPGHEVRITAIDSNAAEYDTLLARLGIEPPCRAIFGHAEELSSIVAPASFDLVHACNSIDHAMDAVKAVREMVNAVKPGRYVFLIHRIREGRHENYAQYHQWNFFPHRSRFFIERPGIRAVDVGQLLKGVAEVTVGSAPEDGGKDMFSAKIRRLVA